MKKYILILLCVALPLASIAQPNSVRKVFRKYGLKEGVVKISIPGIVMDFAAMFVDDAETKKMLKGINKIKVLATDDDFSNANYNFASEALEHFKAQSFEKLLTVRSDDDNVAIYMKEGKRNRKELLIIAGGKDGSVIVYIKGKVTIEMLSSIGKEMNIKSLKTM